MDISKPIIEKEKLIGLLGQFTTQEADILKLRYGVEEPPMPLYKIAELKNMDETSLKLMLRDIEKRMLKMLRENNL